MSSEEARKQKERQHHRLFSADFIVWLSVLAVAASTLLYILLNPEVSHPAGTPPPDETQASAEHHSDHAHHLSLELRRLEQKEALSNQFRKVYPKEILPLFFNHDYEKLWIPLYTWPPPWEQHYQIISNAECWARDHEDSVIDDKLVSSYVGFQSSKTSDIEKYYDAMNSAAFEYVYHHEAFEHNRLNYSDTLLVLQQRQSPSKSVPIDDIFSTLNHLKALAFALEHSSQTENFSFSIEFLSKLHVDLSSNLQLAVPDSVDAELGVWRNHDAALGLSHVLTPYWIEVFPLMDRYIEWLNRCSTELQESHSASDDGRNWIRSALFAFEALYRFTSINPFSNANSKIARLIMNIILVKGGLPLVVISDPDATAYYSLWESPKDKLPFLRHHLELLNRNLASYV
ncbi:uncharacterized protein BJ171DRAFT_216372 [Polychytrium aggregatum]|uniref:uncharacterized protein n=1 Tax=Polychytrium aggregatum TaxID=110093 RepID=UPI0022FEC52C|nr:uncharacterized protein BJ171DRAFT_216372 [Polychytrium aggregatum]KAI9199338.1 hypothetical protein BJ171DRAFT_216372 [Polychytrium aggregatum]